MGRFPVLVVDAEAVLDEHFFFRGFVPERLVGEHGELAAEL